MKEDAPAPGGVLRKNTSSFRSGVALLCVDVAAVMLCFGVSFFIINAIDHRLINFRSFVSYWIYLPGFICVFYGAKLYPGIMLPPADETRRAALSSACVFAFIALSVVVETDSRAAIGAALLLCIPIAVVLIPTMREMARNFFARFSWWGIGVVVYAKGREGEAVVDRLLKRPDLGYRPALIVDMGGAPPYGGYRGIPALSLEEASRAAPGVPAYKTAIIVESPDVDMEKNGLSLDLKTRYRYTILIPRAKISTIALGARDLGGILGFASTHNLTKRSNLFLKRFIDVALCVVFSPLALFVVALAALFVKLGSPGPVFYGQRRVGHNGTPFTAWKFRTMVVDAEGRLRDILRDNPELRAQWDAKQKLENDPRVTRIGKILRASSLDELPQLWNIFKGEMSLVGPRPHPADEFEARFAVYKDRARYLLQARPGLSGVWQVSGRSETSYEDRILMDAYYIENWSIWLDIWVLTKTVGAVVRKRGAV